MKFKCLVNLTKKCELTVIFNNNSTNFVTVITNCMLIWNFAYEHSI